MVESFEHFVGNIFVSTDQNSSWKKGVPYSAPVPLDPSVEPAFYQKFAKSFYKMTGSVNGMCRTAKLLELMSEIADLSSWNTFSKFSSSFRPFLQALNRVGMGENLIANKQDKERVDHWAPYKVAKYLCPTVLLLVSVAGIGCALAKVKIFKELKSGDIEVHRVFQWEWCGLDGEKMLVRTKAFGAGGATLAALFALMQMCHCFWAKHNYCDGQGQPMASLDSEGKRPDGTRYEPSHADRATRGYKKRAEDVHKLGQLGWNNFWAMLKYTCEATALYLWFAEVSKKAQKTLAWAGASCGVIQFFQGEVPSKKGKVKYYEAA